MTTPTPVVECIPLRPALRAGGPTELDLLVRITVPTRERPSSRPQLNIALVLDRSGSMSGKKLACAVQAAAYCVEQLRPTDRIAIVAFDDEITVLTPSRLADERASLLAALHSIQTGGTTALHAGWLEGGTQVADHYDPACLNRVLLLTDGQANVGLQAPEPIAVQVRGLARRGVSTSALGLGRDFNEDLLAAMAGAGDGNYYFAETPEDLPGIFATELDGLAASLGAAVRFRFSRGPGVELLDLLNDLPAEKNVRIDEALPGLATGIRGLDGLLNTAERWRWSVLPNLVHGSTIHVALRLRVAAATGEVPVGDAVLSWQPAGESRRVAGVLDVLTLPAVSDAEYDALQPNPEVEAFFARQTAGRLSRTAIEALDRGDTAVAEQALFAAPVYLSRFSHAHTAHAGLVSEDLAGLERAAATLASGDAVLARKLSHSTDHRRRQGVSPRDETPPPPTAGTDPW